NYFLLINTPRTPKTTLFPYTTLFRSENEKVPFPADAAQNDEINDKEHSQSKVMEVHKHPHHVTHKKKWLEYILEFLMIFLAVFLGFIAENFREDSIEQKRAGEYAQLLYDELK